MERSAVQLSYKNFAEALSAQPSEKVQASVVAANDNKPVRKDPQPRYRGTLPALRWLYDNHPELAEPVAIAVRSLSESGWSGDATDNDQEIRPTIGELMRATVDPDTGEDCRSVIKADKDGNTSVWLGPLKFVGGELVEYGQTKKGRKLQPRDRVTPRGEEGSNSRNPNFYVFRTPSQTLSPMRAEPYQHPISTDPALMPMYAPQAGVEENRALLQSLGVDGSVPFNHLPGRATKCPPAIAKGAEFFGGIIGSSGTSSGGALMWEAPERQKGEAHRVVEQIASGASLKDIGEALGFTGVRVDRLAKLAIVDTALTLVAANDNSRKKLAA